MYKSAAIPQNMRKGNLRIFFHKNAVRLSLFWRNIIPFSYVEPFSNDNSANGGTIKFLTKFGEIFPSLRKLGDEAKNPITGY